METRAAAMAARALFQRAMGMLWRRWGALGRAHRLPARVGLLAVVVLTGVLTPLVPVVLGAAPRAHAAPAVTPPHGSAPYGALPLQPNQPTPALPASSWQGPSPKALPAAKDTPASATAASGPARTPGEQADLRTAASKTFLNADGTWTLKAFSGPVHYQDAQGHWQDIKTAVAGDTTDAGYAYGVTANSWTVHFAQESGGPKLLHVQAAGANLAETLDGAAQAPAALAGASVVYAGVFPGVDLRYNVGTRTLEEELILHDANGPASYTFSYHVPGASATQDATGMITFTDTQGNVLLRIGGVAMYEADATGRMAAKGAGTDRVAMALSGTGPDYTVTLTPDAAWLADPVRVFPVAIDPTLGPLSQPEGQAGYGDTFAESGNPGLNFYNVNAERIGNCNALPSGAPGYNTGTNRAFIIFPVGAAPQAARVTSATLTLWQTTAYAATAVNANLIRAAWNDTTLTWNNQPTAPYLMGTATANATFITAMNMDVTYAAYDWWQGGLANYGLELQYADESQPCDFFASDDYGDTTKLPSLTITYVQDLSTQNGSPSGNVSINGVTVGTALFTNSATVALSPTWSDPGATNVWSSDWRTTSAAGTNGYPAAAWSVDAAGSQLTADTSSCGTTACWTQTYIPGSVVASMTSYPTFTAMFKTDTYANFHFAVTSSANVSTRFGLLGDNSNTGFTTLEYSTTAGAFALATGLSVPLSANTWYYGQIDFPRSTIGEITIWPAGQAKPATPTVIRTGIVMDHPGLTFWQFGNNSGASKRTYSIGNALATSGTTGYGVSQVQFSNDGVTFSCPAPAGGTWCVAAQRQTGWTLPTGDGLKTVYLRFRDNAGNLSGVGHNGIQLDATPPNISISATAPAAGRDMRGLATISGDASDATSGSGINTVAFLVDGVQVGPAANGASHPQFGWDTTTALSGWHQLTMVATDFAGNTKTSAPVAVAVSNGGQMPYMTFAKRTLPDGKTSVGVDTANGDAIVEHTDFAVPGLGPELALTRTYNNQMPVNNLFGYGWTSDFDERVLINTTDNSVSYFDASGGVHLFVANGSGGYTTPPGLFASLVKNVADGTFTLTGHDQSVTSFNAAGFVTRIADRHGNALTVTYASPTTLTPTTVTDAGGRQLTITLSGGHVTHISGPDGISYAYAYDASGNLTDFTDQADSVNFAVTTHYGYDAGGHHWLSAIWFNYANGGTNTAGMDPVANNVETTLTYDATVGDANFSRLLSFTDPLGFDVDMNYGCFYPFAACSTPTSTTGVPGSVLVQQLQTNTTTTTPTTTPAQYETTRYKLTTDGVGTVAEIDLPAPDFTTPLKTTYTYDTGTGGKVGNGLLTQVAQQVDQASPTIHWHVNTYTYDASGNLTQQVIGTTSADGTASSPENLNLTTTYTYDSANNLTEQVSPLGVVSVSVYDAPSSGNLLTTVAHCVNQTVGGVTCPTVTSLDGSENNTTTHSYDAGGHGEVVTTTDPAGIVTLYAYDGYGNVTQTVQNCVNQTVGGVACPTKAAGDIDDTANTTTSATYDAQSEQTSATDALGAVTRTDYDIRGRVTQTIANCLNATTATVTCPTNTDPADPNTQNVTTTYSYDALDRVTAANVPLDLNKAQHTVTASFYDADGRVTRTVRNCVNGCPAGAASDTSTNVTTTTAYDAAGNTTLATDPAGNQTYTTFDALNRPVDVKQQSGGATPTVVSDKQTNYDGAGNVVSTVVDPGDPNGTPPHKNLTTTYTFDAANRTKTKTEPPAVPGATDASGQSTLTTYSYDKDGHVTDTQVTNVAAQNPTVGDTTVTYDALGRPVTKTEHGGTNPDGSVHLLTTTYVYNPDSTLHSTTDPNGHLTTATRDQLGQVTVLSQPDGTDKASYDKAGHTIQTSNGNGHTVYTYDALWRVIKEEHYDAHNVLVSTTSHAYDASGHELAPITTLADGTQTGLTYTYDALGRIASVSDNARTYSYDANGRVGSMSVYSDPAKTSLAYQASYGYDPGARTSTLTDLVGPTATALHNYSYSYDPANNITSVSDAIGGASSSQSYTYDDLNQLKTVTDGTGTTAFSYDANHNRTQMVAVVAGTNFTTSYTYDAQADQELLSKTDPSNKTTVYTYDTAGNLTQAVYDPTTLDPGGANLTTSFTYDTSGRLTTVTEPNGTTVAFTYDADGNRASKTVTTGGPAPTTTVVRDVYQAGRIAYQTDGSGMTLATFTYDSNGIPASVQVGADPATAPRYFYVYNAHGDVVALVDASGNTVATYSYDVFGDVTATETLPGGWSNPYRYDGKDRVRYDSETSLYWMSVRAYDPTLGRFISRDPLNRQPLVWQNQPYVYGANNPLTNVDPSGQLLFNSETLPGDVTIDLRHGNCNIAMCPHVRTSGGAGSGANGQPGTQPPIPNDFVVHHTADEIATGQADAYNTAIEAKYHFYAVSAVLTILAAAMTAGVFIFGANPIMAGAFAGAAAALAYLAGAAVLIALMFDQDVSAAERGSPITLGVVASEMETIGHVALGLGVLDALTFLASVGETFRQLGIADKLIQAGTSFKAASKVANGLFAFVVTFYIVSVSGGLALYNDATSFTTKEYAQTPI